MLLFVEVIVTAGSIELISLSFKVHGYLYFSGMILVVIGAMGFVPLGWKMAVGIITVVYTILIAPVLVFSPSAFKSHVFIMVNAYLLSSSFLALIWRINHQKLLIDWLKLQYNLKEIVAGQSLEIEEKEHILTSLMDTTQEAVLLVKINGQVVRVNKNANKYMHATVGMQMQDIYNYIGVKNIPDFRTLRNYEITGVVNDKKIIYNVYVTQTTIKDEPIIKLVHYDVTEQRTIQKYLVKTEKINTVNLFLSGTMHDFKNLLSLINIFIQWLQKDYCPPTCPMFLKIKDNAEKISHEISKSKKTFKNFSNVYGNEEDVWNVHDINKLVVVSVGMVVIGLRGIEIKEDLCTEQCFVYCNENMLKSVLLNLIINAKNAVEHGNGIVVVTTRNTPDHVELSVSDNGCGICTDNLKHMFEPFFTTNKEHGTGLGLYMVKNIIKQHNGSIDVQSSPGKTVFTVLLPKVIKPSVYPT